jgi:3-dehydroquinate dehydratase-2
MKILVVNGPNLDLLGAREPEVYGSDTLDAIMERLIRHGNRLGVEVEARQSNAESDMISLIGKAGSEFDGVIVNPAAYTHTSIALRDALTACSVPCVEVHLSNVHAREEFRHRNLTAGACLGQVQGFGPASYELALEGLVSHLRQESGAARE